LAVVAAGDTLQPARVSMDFPGRLPLRFGRQGGESRIVDRVYGEVKEMIEGAVRATQHVVRWLVDLASDDSGHTYQLCGRANHGS
jgi:hypothetical protein